jgi:hypothetical protein
MYRVCYFKNGDGGRKSRKIAKETNIIRFSNLQVFCTKISKYGKTGTVVAKVAKLF